jgi:hypothetical protein
MACDVDEVIVHISPKWMRMAIGFLNDPKLNEFYKTNYGSFDKVILGRKMDYIQQWLKEDFNISQEKIDVIDKMYFENPTFYDDLEPTYFAKSLMFLMDVKKLHHITFITQNRKADDVMNPSKQKFLNKHFGKYDVRIVEVFEKRKSEVINELGPFDVFVDDSIKNVADVVAFVKPGMLREIIIPSLGFNQEIPKIVTGGAQFVKDISIAHYEVKELEEKL